MVILFFRRLRQFVKFLAGRIIVQHHSIVMIAPSYTIKVVALIIGAFVARFHTKLFNFVNVSPSERIMVRRAPSAARSLLPPSVLVVFHDVVLVERRVDLHQHLDVRIG